MYLDEERNIFTVRSQKIDSVGAQWYDKTHQQTGFSFSENNGKYATDLVLCSQYVRRTWIYVTMMNE